MGKIRQLNKEVTRKLQDLYYNPSLPSSLGGQANLQHNAPDVPSSKIKEWLLSQDAYTLHKKVNRKFKRRPTIVSGANIQYQADLIDMSKFSKHNTNYKYILTVIDVFSKFGWCKPLKTKHGSEISLALQGVLTLNPCKDLQTDKGKEFYNKSVRKLLERLAINHFSTENDDIKASIVERFNRTIQSKIYRWFSYKNTNNWINILQKITDGYNATKHSVTKVAPNDVKKFNQEDIWLNIHLQEGIPTHKRSELQVDDPVRISRYKHIFEKGYDKNWSTEVFLIDKIEHTRPITYRLRDQKNERIHGTYYFNELQKVALPKVFLLDDIIKEKGIGRKKEYLVSYKGYPSKFNEWITHKQLINLQQN